MNLDLGSESKLTDSSNKSITTAQKVIGAIKNIVQVVSIFVAVIMLVILATKYMISSVADRAEIKKHAVVYAIGALIIFSINGIIGIIQFFSSRIQY